MNIAKRRQVTSVAEKREAKRRELLVEGRGKEEQRAKEVERDESQLTEVRLGYQTAR